MDRVLHSAVSVQLASTVTLVPLRAPLAVQASTRTVVRPVKIVRLEKNLEVVPLSAISASQDSFLQVVPALASRAKVDPTTRVHGHPANCVQLEKSPPPVKLPATTVLSDKVSRHPDRATATTASRESTIASRVVRTAKFVEADSIERLP